MIRVPIGFIILLLVLLYMIVLKPVMSFDRFLIANPDLRMYE